MIESARSFLHDCDRMSRNPDSSRRGESCEAPSPSCPRPRKVCYTAFLPLSASTSFDFRGCSITRAARITDSCCSCRIFGTTLPPRHCSSRHRSRVMCACGLKSSYVDMPGPRKPSCKRLSFLLQLVSCRDCEQHHRKHKEVQSRDQLM